MVDALSLCHGCLSADRELSPICQFSDMFTMICQRKVRVPGMTDIYFCWECTATLKRIQTFNMQVNKAQDKLRLYIRKKDNLLPKSLSKLNTSKTNHDFISFTETEIEIKKEDYSDFSDAHNDEEELQEDPTSIDDLKDIEQCVTESEIKIKNEDDSDFSNAPNEAEELKPDPSFIVDLKDLKEKPQNERLRYYDHISTAEEMCVKEQARQSDLVHFWVGHGCHPQGYDASSTMCMESEDHLKAEFSKNENIETYNSNHNEISKKSESKPRKRGSTWDEDSLRRAMEAVQNNQLNTNAAALKFNIPRRTLRNHLLSGNSTKIIGKTTILTKQQEEDLSQRIKRFAKLGVPLTPKFISKQAFLFCESFKIKNSFNTSTRMAGRKWLKMFLSRNPSISNGNKATGLYPFDPDVIPEDAYAPSIVTERPLSETLLHQIDQPLISVQVSPPMSEFKEVSELSSQSLVDERSADVSDVSSIFPSTSKETSPKFSTATPKRKPVLVSCSSSKDVSDLELVTVSGRFNVADTKHDPQTSLYDNPLPSTSGLELNRLKRKVQKQNSKSLKIEKKKSVMVLPVSERILWTAQLSLSFAYLSRA